MAQNVLDFSVKASGTAATSSAIGGLATKFVGLQAAVNLAQQAIKVLQKWVGESIKRYREFEKSVAEVSTLVSGEHEEMINQLQAGIENLSVSYGKSVKDLTEGLYDIISAAIDVEDSIRLLNTATKAAIAGVTDVSTSVDVFTSILNAYGKTVAQAAYINDVLFQTVKRGKLRFEDLASAMGYIVPIAASLGVEFEEIAAAFQSATRQGQHIDMVTRGLALMLQNIADITPAASKAAMKYGVDLSHVALQVFGLKSVLVDLNTAMHEHGTAILPEMIRNMRSYRVAIALASDVGIAGFSQDLEYLEHASGKATEALNKMTKTAQMQADIISQSMEQVNRSVGEAWSDIDLWWKKAQVWWGTFFGEGFDPFAAGKKVDDLEKHIYKLNEAYVNTLSTTKNLEKYSDSLFDKLSKEAEITADDLKNSLPLADALAYIKAEDELANKQTELVDILKDQLKFQHALEGIKQGEDLTENWDTVFKMSQKYDWGKAGADAGKDMVLGLAIPIKSFFDAAGNLSNIVSLDFAKSTRSIMSKPFEEVNEELLEMVKNGKLAEQEMQYMLNSYQEAWDYVEGSFDGAEEQMKTWSEDILTLQNEIKKLSVEVEKSYTVLSGQTFAGTLRWEKEVKTMEAMSDRFSTYSSMIIKYGDDSGKLFERLENSFKTYNDSLEDADDSIGWFNKDLWETVKLNTGYDKSLKNLIKQLHEYKNVQSSVTKEVDEYNDALDAINLAMKRTNLELMQLQLKGMQKRHGLSRGDQRKMKKLQIEGMEQRIQATELEIGMQESKLSERVEMEQNKYNELKAIYDEYVDRFKLNMFELQDGRNTDLIDMQTVIDTKEGYLVKYRSKLIEVQDDMLSLWRAYYIALDQMSKDPSMSAIYERLAGTKRMEAMGKWWEQFEDWSENIEIPKTPTFENTAPSGSAGMSKMGKGGSIPLIGTPGQASKKATSRGVITPSTIARDAIIGGIGWFKENIFGKQRGSYYIPETKPYLLHKGERVMPAKAGNSGAGNVNIHVEPIKVNAVIRHTDDIESIGSKIGQAIAAEIVSGVESKYEVG